MSAMGQKADVNEPVEIVRLVPLEDIVVVINAAVSAAHHRDLLVGKNGEATAAEMRVVEQT
jgi:hypothetical protein